MNDLMCEKFNKAFSPETPKINFANKIFLSEVCMDIVSYYVEITFDFMEVISAFVKKRYPEGKTKSIFFFLINFRKF